MVCFVQSDMACQIGNICVILFLPMLPVQLKQLYTSILFFSAAKVVSKSCQSLTEANAGHVISYLLVNVCLFICVLEYVQYLCVYVRMCLCV